MNIACRLGRFELQLTDCRLSWTLRLLVSTAGSCEMFAHTRFSAFCRLLLLLRQKIGTFDQAKRLIFVYDPVEDTDA